MKVASDAAASCCLCIATIRDWAKRARNILHQTGAEDVSSTGEARADFATSDKPIRPRSRVITKGEEMAMKNIAAFGILSDQGTVKRRDRKT